MINSETSSDIKIKYENSNGENLLEEKYNTKKTVSSDTDYYFNIIANPNKILQSKRSETSDIDDIINESDSISSNSSKSTSKSNRSSSHHKSNKSNNNSDTSLKSSESREKYEKIQPNIIIVKNQN